MFSFYLNKISEFQNIFKTYGFSVKVGGGFAIDGFLQKETREHSDLDLDIVGNVSWEEGFAVLKKVVLGKFQTTAEKKEHLEIKEGENKIDIEYVRDLSANGNFKYHFGDAEYEFPFPLYLDGGGKLGDLVFDIENPSMIFAIKYLMPIDGSKKIREKDYKDIENLLPHLSKKELLKALKFQLEYIEGRVAL